MRVFTMKTGTLLGFGVIVLLHTVLSIGHALTLRPWSDEGAMACPAYNLIHHGNMGTTIWEETGSEFKGLNQRTYYLMPLYLLAEAPWFSAVGVSLVKMRVFSWLWALLALWSWFVILRCLTRDYAVILLGTLLIGLDYHFVTGSSFGRMDMMSASLGFAGLAIFLSLREKNLTAALAWSNVLVAASVFSHPIAMVHFFGLQALTLWFHRKNLSVKRLAIIGAPYLLATGLWLVYILQSPSDFRAQFAANANYMGRLSGVTEPWMGVVREVTLRYGIGFGLGPHSTGSSGPVWLKSIALLTYVLAIIVCLIVPKLRRSFPVKVLLVLITIYFLIMSVIDGGKNTYYLIHTLPLLAALLAVTTVAGIRCNPRLAWFLLPVIAGVLLIETGAIAYKIRLNSYLNRYVPAVEFVKQRLKPDGLIFATSAFGFDFGFRQEHLIDDARLGYDSGRRADFVVVDEIYEIVFDGHRRERPAIGQYVDRALATKYKLVYDRAQIRIYERLTGVQNATRPHRDSMLIPVFAQKRSTEHPAGAKLTTVP